MQLGLKKGWGQFLFIYQIRLKWLAEHLASKWEIWYSWSRLGRSVKSTLLRRKHSAVIISPWPLVKAFWPVQCEVFSEVWEVMVMKHDRVKRAGSRGVMACSNKVSNKAAVSSLLSVLLCLVVKIPPFLGKVLMYGGIERFTLDSFSSNPQKTCPTLTISNCII